jgi:hypothetical protein
MKQEKERATPGLYQIIGGPGIFYNAIINCPHCGKRHVDSGEWGMRLHHTHLCEHCGKTFRIEGYVFGV